MPQSQIAEVMVDFKKELNREQWAAVEGAEGPCLVLAGAGSGKTRVITYRVAYLLKKGTKPENILLLTFTNKAAKEMLFRVEKLAGKEIRGLWGGTFHAVANRLLRLYAKEIGYQPNFTVLDEDDAETLLKSVIKELGLAAGSRRFPSAGVIQNWLSFSRNALAPLAEVVEWRSPQLASFADDIQETASRYQQRKKTANAMDFDDLLENWLDLLKKRKEILNRLAGQFHYILVDEYQDTNRLQAEIVKLLASRRENLLVVGDDAQSIYSFRAADINNILEFKKDFPKAKIFKLETNYRSTPDILDLANEVISQNSRQFAKNLKSPLRPHLKPQLVATASPFAEAEFVAKRLAELKEAGHRLSDMAVLFRAAFHAQVLEMELAKRGLPYDFRGGLRFFERAHVKDALSFLRLVNNFRDELAWWRVLEIFPGIGPETAKLLVKESQKASSLEQVLGENYPGLPERARKGWREFKEVVVGLLKENESGPAKSIEAILKSSYADYLESAYENAADRLDDLKQLSFYASRAKSLSQFLADISLDENFRRPQDKKQDKIVLSTIHQAKGLEWEAVFLINLVKGALPNERALKEPGGEEEERRLFYVAITRAKNHLYLTCPLAGAGGMQAISPSPFLENLKDDLLNKNYHEESGFGEELPVIQLG